MKSTSRWLAACWILVGTALLGLSLVSPTRSAAQTPATTVLAAPSVTPTVTAVPASNDDATNVINMVGTMMSFIQVLGFLITALAVPLLAAGVAVGLRTINQYGQEVKRVRTTAASFRDQVKEARTDLEQAKTELQDMRASLLAEVERRLENLAQLETEIKDRMQEMFIQGEQAILALELVQLGIQQVSGKNLPTALQIFQEAYAMEPDSPLTNYFLGDLYTRLGKPDEGLQYLDKALRNKEYVPMEATLAYALRLKGDKETDPDLQSGFYAQAETLFLKIFNKNPRLLDINGEAMEGSLAGIYRRVGRYADAIRWYERATRVTPGSSYPVSKLGLLYRLTDNDTQATHCFERTIVLAGRNLDGDPFDYWARFDMVIAQVALNRIDDALKTLEPVMEYSFDPHALNRLLEGLNTLKEVSKSSDGIDAVIARARQLFEDQSNHNRD